MEAKEERREKREGRGMEGDGRKEREGRGGRKRNGRTDNCEVRKILRLDSIAQRFKVPPIKFTSQHVDNKCVFN